MKKINDILNEGKAYKFRPAGLIGKPNYYIGSWIFDAKQGEIEVDIEAAGKNTLMVSVPIEETGLPDYKKDNNIILTICEIILTAANTFPKDFKNADVFVDGDSIDAKNVAKEIQKYDTFSDIFAGVTKIGGDYVLIAN